MVFGLPGFDLTTSARRFSGDTKQPDPPEIHWGIILRPKMIILQGVGHLIPQPGVCETNDPRKQGYMAPAPVLDLATLFEVISHNPDTHDEHTFTEY